MLICLAVQLVFFLFFFNFFSCFDRSSTSYTRLSWFTLQNMIVNITPQEGEYSLNYFSKYLSMFVCRLLVFMFFFFSFLVFFCEIVHFYVMHDLLN